MEIVKLNRKYRAFKEGYTHAFRWPMWESEVTEVIKTLQAAYGKDWCNRDWATGFGSRARSGDFQGFRPFFVYVSGEELISYILLTLD